MADAKLVTARELAEKAGVSPEVSRKIFCEEFNWGLARHWSGQAG